MATNSVCKKFSVIWYNKLKGQTSYYLNDMIVGDSGVLLHIRNRGQSGFYLFILTLLIFLLSVGEVRAGRQFDGPVRHGSDDEVIYIGVLANRGEKLCLVEWGPTADCL